MPIQLDEQQYQAVNALDKNILVSASAGAGKTGVLVQRLKKRVVQDHVRVSRILAMTFTAAAASEMKKRLASELHSAFIQVTDEKEKQWLTQQLIELEASNITTIDSYCLTIIKKYYSVIGLDPATTQNILAQGSVTLYKQDAYQTALKELIDEDEQSAYYLLSYFSARAEDYSTLESIVHSINQHAQSMIDPELWYEQAKNSYAKINRLSDLPEETIDCFYSRIQLKLEMLLSYSKQMRMFGEGDAKVDYDLIQQRENCIHNCINAIKNHNYGMYSNSLETLALSTTKPGSKENVSYKTSRKKQEDSIKTLLAENYDEKQLISDHNDLSEIAETLIELSKRTWEIFIREKQENAVMDFSDMERYAFNILCANKNTVAHILQDSFDEIMVDEFQDTSDLQNAIIDMISNGHNVFRVGDVKQSIYRFRQAKPSLMRNLMLDEDTIQITLRHNFRSMNSIVEFSNHLFQRIMNVDGCKDSYSELDTVSVGSDRQKEDIVPVEFALIHLGESDEEDELGGKEQKAHWITRKILTMKKEDPSLKFKDFCILVRSHADKAIIRSAFDQYNIPYMIDAREGFYQSELCQTILAMIRVIKNPKDEISLISVLVSHYYDFSDNDLARLKIQYGTIYDGICIKHKDILEEFKELRQIAEYEGVLDLLTKISISHNFYNRLNDSQKANFDYLFELVSNSRIDSLQDFLDVMEASEDEKSSEAVSKGKDDDVVTVTTIHQSKGLQYANVFLWSTSENRFRDTSSAVMIDDVLKLGITHLTMPNRVKRPTIQRMAVEYHSNLEDIEEFIRLLYVAITRAEKRLFIVDATKKDLVEQDVDLSLLSQRNGMTGLIINAMINDPYFKMCDIEEMDVEKYKPISRNYVSKLPHLKEQPHLLSNLYTPSSTEVKQLPDLDASSKLSGTNYGTKIHETMEVLPNREWTFDDLEVFDLTKSDKERILHFSNSDIYKKALSMKIYKEFPFYVDQNNERITGTMDFVAISDSEIILIDYKTDNTTNEEIKNRYTSQLNTYKKALQIMYPNTIITAYAYSFHNEAFIEI